MWKWLEGKKSFLTQISDKVWDNPETDYNEYVSSDILCKALESEGFKLQRQLAGIPTAFCASYGQGKPVIAFLGEYDALPGLSQIAGEIKPCPVPGGNGNGHGCGHNLLGTGNLGAAIALKEYVQQNNLSATILYFGCPAEEGGSGKAVMARAGVFENVDIALSWHPNMLNSVWSFSTLANVKVEYHFKGTSSHAANSPHLGRSALDALELMNVGVQFLREHMIPEARIHYAITDTGGSAANVVQASAKVEYLIRAPLNEEVKELYERVNQIAQGAAMMSGVTVEHTIQKACSNIIVNRTIEKILHQNMTETKLPEYTDEEYAYASALQETMPDRQTLEERFSKSMGDKGRKFGAKCDQKSIYGFVMPYSPSEKPISASSDVGDVSWICPTSQIVAATCAGGTAEHTWQLTAQGKSSIAHKGMLYAARVLAGAAVDLLENPELIEEAKQEHRERIGSKGYQSLIPDELEIQDLIGTVTSK